MGVAVAAGESVGCLRYLWSLLEGQVSGVEETSPRPVSQPIMIVDLDRGSSVGKHIEGVTKFVSSASLRFSAPFVPWSGVV